MVSAQRSTRPFLQFTRDVAGIDARLRAVAAGSSDDPSDPEIDYYAAAELHNRRAPILRRIWDGAS